MQEIPPEDPPPADDGPDSQDWPDVRRWRKRTRARLLERRLALPERGAGEAAAIVGNLEAAGIPELEEGRISFYWPFKGEIDLRPFLRARLAGGARGALPVVVEKNCAMEFWHWQPRMKMSAGIWNIPVPAERQPVRPDVVLVPLLGFDAAGYRLGYGGGYYDRTLAGLSPPPLTLGVGYECGRLETIHPQPHDVPLDAIATERGIAWHRSRGRPLDEAGFASPPCFRHEVDPTPRQ